MKARFAVYEIEHGGDESSALAALAAGGCKAVKVLRRDYEGEEAILVEAELPADMASVNRAAMAARFPEVIFW